MPRTNFFIIMLAAVVSLVCYRVQDRNPYGRYFAEVMDHIENEYVEPVDPDQLFETAVKGMMKKLDENSSYFGRDDSKRFRESLEQEFGGIGISVSADKKTKGLAVMGTMIDTPAQRAGIRAGDKIIKVDGQDIRGLAVDEITKKMKGPIGEPVALTLIRQGKIDPFDTGPIKRAMIPVPSVLGDTLNQEGHFNFFVADHPEIAYIRIDNFGKHTEENLNKTMQQLSERGIQGLILDLRDNPGGYLETAIHTCDMFIESGTIVTTRGRDGRVRDKYEATAPGTYTGFPMVVLVNRHSASASEIIAACLQDHGRAVVIGERSFGKGTVQNVIPVTGGKSDLKLTTAYYWRPNDKNIHRKPDPKQPDKRQPESEEWGVTPDAGYEQRLTDDEFRAWKEWRFMRDRLTLDEVKRGADRPAGMEADVDEGDEEGGKEGVREQGSEKGAGDRDQGSEKGSGVRDQGAGVGSGTEGKDHGKSDTASDAQKPPPKSPSDSAGDAQMQKAVEFLLQELAKQNRGLKAA